MRVVALAESSAASPFQRVLAGGSTRLAVFMTEHCGPSGTVAVTVNVTLWSLASVRTGDRQAWSAREQDQPSEPVYRGHKCPPPHDIRIYTAGQKRGMTDAVLRKMRRRSAIEPVIGHMKAEHRMGRNHLAGAKGDATNALLAAAGYNFRRLLKWLAIWLALIACTLRASPNPHPA